MDEKPKGRISLEESGLPTRRAGVGVKGQWGWVDRALSDADNFLRHRFLSTLIGESSLSMIQDSC